MQLLKNSVIIVLITASSIGAMESVESEWRPPKEPAPYLTAEQEQAHIIQSLGAYKLIARRKNASGFKKGSNFKRSPRSQICYDHVINALKKGSGKATVIKRSAENALVSIGFCKDCLFEFDAKITKLINVIAQEAK